MSLTVTVYDAYTGDPGARLRALSGNLVEIMNSYTHTINLAGGYDSMSIDFSGDTSSVQFWFDNGIGRHIETLSPSGEIIWEGFINSVSVSIGGLSASVGPMLDMANRVYVTYTGTSWTALGVTLGGRQKTTDVADDADSQSLYGIIEEYVSGGTGSETEMNTLRDAHLADRAQPFVTEAAIDLLGGSEPTIRLECVGYYKLLDKYRYSNNTLTSSNASDKIQDIVAADPSTRFSTDYTDVFTNTLTLFDKEDEQRTGGTIIKEIIAFGDTSDRRYTFGIYEDRKIRYAPIEETAFYEYDVSSSLADVARIDTGAAVSPWDVVPGKWLIINSIATSEKKVGSIGDLRASPSAIFIEEVSFTAPYSLSLRSGPTSTFPQKLARLGLQLK
jgi:hypothetical protein